MLIDTFGSIERHFSCMFDDASQITTELEAVLKKMVEMSETIKPLKELPSEQSKLEVGESSKTKITNHEEDKRDEIPYSFDENTIIKLNLDLALVCCTLSAFSENYKLNKRSLIYWWIALELVHTGRKRTDKDIEEIFFNDLVSLGFLKPLEGTKSVVVDGCIVESKVHEQLIEAAKRRNFITDGPNYHFHVNEIQTKKGKFDTLINFDKKYLKSDDIQKRMTHNNNNNNNQLCVLQLGQCSMEPRHIEVDKTDFLKELKPILTYLSLQGILRITELLDSIGNL